MTEGRTLRADARRNRDRLLRTAKAAFAEDGLSVSLDEIARRAGVGPGTLYRHFPTKEALFEAVVYDRVRGLVDEARELGAAADPGAALFGFVDRLVAEAAAKQDLVDALTGAGVELRTNLTGMAADLRDAIKTLLTRAQQAGAVRDDIEVADLMALVSGLWLALRAPANRAADPERALSVLRDGLRA